MKMNSERARELLRPIRDGSANWEAFPWRDRTLEALERVVEAESEISRLHQQVEKLRDVLEICVTDLESCIEDQNHVEAVIDAKEVLKETES